MNILNTQGFVLFTALFALVAFISGCESPSNNIEDLNLSFNLDEADLVFENSNHRSLIKGESTEQMPAAKCPKQVFEISSALF